MAADAFTQFIRQRLVDLDISISELTVRANISRQAYYCLVKKPQAMRVSTLLTLANALEVEPQVLLRLFLRDV